MKKTIYDHAHACAPLGRILGLTLAFAAVLGALSFISRVGAQTLLSKDYVKQAWEASAHSQYEEIDRLVGECRSVFGEEAKRLQARLKGFPDKGTEGEYAVLDDVATCLFIQAEALMNRGETERAKTMFREIIQDYSWAQSWDPRGWYWSVAEKSQASLDKLEGKFDETQQTKADRGDKTLPTLFQKGTEDFVDYTKYGRFMNVGTKDYVYEVDDPVGLQNAVGEGIYPNTGAVLKDPEYRRLLKEGRLTKSHWDLVQTDDLQAAFYKWVTAPEPLGVKLFYLGLVFERAKMIPEALKAYRAIQVHFPSAVAKTYWNTPWYPGQAAIAKIRHLVRLHPELDLVYKGAKIQVINGFDNDVSNDIVLTWPGELRKKDWKDRLVELWEKYFSTKTFQVPIRDIKRSSNNGKVRLVQSAKTKHWQLQVDGKPFMIHGLTYTPTKVGESPDKGTLSSWMTQDTNNNGKPDGPYDSWVDKNRNDAQDADEPVIGDFELMRQLGANAIRVYKQPYNPDKKVLRDMYEKYGIRVIMGDFLGKYALGSGATWFEGTDYENETHKKNMMDSVRKMVEEFKDEPYILMWLLGNENNFGLGCNADKKPAAYYQFVEEVAQMVKSIDKDHPVAICNGDTLFLDIFAENCPSVDAFGVNAYRGDYGFGALWEQVFDATGRPAFITEYGCPAFANFLDRDGAEQAQADYHKGAWDDIILNASGTHEGTGNALGGVVFQWMDEWWKNYEPAFHDRTAGALGPFPDGYMYEEWFGLIDQGDGKNSPFLRQLRKSFFFYQKAWHP